MQTNKWNYHRLIIIDKSKMAASKMADLSLEWLYLSYYSTQKGDVLGFMVQLMQWIQLNDHLLSVLTNPIWRYPKWRPCVVLHPCTTLSPQLHSTFMCIHIIWKEWNSYTSDQSVDGSHNLIYCHPDDIETVIAHHWWYKLSTEAESQESRQPLGLFQGP